MLVAIIKMGTLATLPVINRSKVGMPSKHHAPYDLGYPRATMVGTTSRESVTASKSLKANLSSDCRLQLAYMKSESLVIADQHGAVNTFPGLLHTPPVTPREFVTPEVGDVTF